MLILDWEDIMLTSKPRALKPEAKQPVSAQTEYAASSPPLKVSALSAFVEFNRGRPTAPLDTDLSRPPLGKTSPSSHDLRLSGLYIERRHTPSLSSQDSEPSHTPASPNSSC